MSAHGERLLTAPSAVAPEVASVILEAFAHRHAVVHLISTAADESDAVRRIAEVLQAEEPTMKVILDRPIRWMLPQFRAELEAAAGRSLPPAD